MARSKLIDKGESLDFVFDRDGLTIDGWVCELSVKKFTQDTSLITARNIPAKDGEFPGTLTQTESASLGTGPHVLIGKLTHAADDKEEVKTIRFNVGENWI